MLKSKFGKKLAASAVALAMTASASAASLATLTAFAGEMTGEGTFENGAGLPWHVCENGTGSMEFNINDGVYSILIKCPGGTSNGGDDRWDCQFRHRGMTITYGHKYRLTYSVYATNAGKMYAKIGDIGSDDTEYWHNNGNKLSLEYKEGMTQSELASALKSASGKDTGKEQSQWDVAYYQGWDAWKQDEIPANKWKCYAWEFYIDKSLRNDGPEWPEAKGTVEWTFHFGGDGQFTPSVCFPEGTILKFDNLCLIDMDGDENDYVPEQKAEPSGLAINQRGFFPKTSKQATLAVEKGAAASTWKITGPETASGTTGATFFDPEAGEYCQKIDFTKDITKPGKYTLTVGGVSADFTVADDVYGDLLRDSLNYFYLNRSGIEIEEKYIANSGANSSTKALARKAGHDPDKAYITDEWVALYTERENSKIASKYSANGTKDVTGGWYDAGDYGKYVVNGGVSMWTLANAYERNPEKFAVGADFINIPESGNSIPDILDEIAWEAEFFIKMTRDDGMVYHKMHDYKWTALGVMPYDESEGDEDKQTVIFPTRIIKPVTYAATLNSAAALAQLSRLVKPYDSSLASKYEKAAIKNYDAAKSLYVKNYGSIYADAKDAAKEDAHSLFAPLTQNKGGGPYGDTQVTDEFYWAACELYVTTGDKTYYEDLKGSDAFAFKVITNLVGGENKGSPTTFTWGTLSSLGTATLALHQDMLTEAEAKTVVTQFQEAGDYYLKMENESGYGSPYPGHTYQTTVTDIVGDTATERSINLEGGYEWGSNSMVINNAMIMGMAYDVTNDVKYLNGVTVAMDYILGRNPLENCYITGYGQEGKQTENPHHRYWCNQMKPDWPHAPNGCLSGGPNSDMNDPMIKGAGYKIGELAPMKCYYDNVDAWSVNEITINWNSPVVWISSFVEDEAPNAGEAKDPDPTKPTTGDKVYGDVDCDGDVDIVDVIALNKNLMIGEKISDQGLTNADVDDNGEVTEVDSLNILKYCVKLITSFPVK